MNEVRRQNIINKYGSLEEYERLRNLKVRETALKKCATEEERQKKIRQWEWEDYLKSISDESLIGKEVVCKECNNIFIAPKSQQSYCSKCILKLARIRNFGSLDNYYKVSYEHQKATMQELYGVDNAMQSSTFQKKALETKKELYGEHLEGIVEESKKTKLERYGDEGYTNIEQRRKTNLQRYGAECNWSNKENHDKCVATGLQNDSYKKAVVKAKKTKLEKYGDENYTNFEKRKETNLSKYGYISPFGNEEVREKSKKTLLEKYGVDNIAKEENERKHRSEINKANPTIYLPGVKEKIMKSCLANGGFMHRNTFFYENLYFDSSWELYYYIYLKDHNINFIYKPDGIDYLIDGRTHTYYPDFYTDHFVEIKGDHLLDDDGVLLSWSGDRLLEKTEALRKNNVEILTYNNLKPIIDEIDNKYGTGFVKQFKVVKNGKAS